MELAVVTRMSTRTRTALLAVGLAAVVLPTAACGSGRYNENYREVSYFDAANVNVGTLQIRNVQFLTPAPVGGTTTLSFSVYDAITSDTLTAIRVDGISSAPVTLATADGTPVPQIPIEQTTGPKAATFTARVTGLTTQLQPATYHTVTMIFAKNGKATLLVPVQHIGLVAPNASTAPKDYPDSPVPSPTGVAAPSASSATPASE